MSKADTTNELTSLTLTEARDAMKSGATSSVELTSAYLAAIEAANPKLNAFITITAEEAMEAARGADGRRETGEDAPLLGLPLAIKDLFATRGVGTTAGSQILGPFVPDYESTVTANLWRDGAVPLGKLNLDEFAMGSSNETSAFGPVINPWRRGDTDLVPGGSSGGSAAAVAAHLCVAATGTDTGGSIRQPAAFTGTVGIKPTYGRCSRWGIVAFASSLDQAGPFGRTVEDAATLLTSMAGFDPKDSTCVDRPVPAFEAALTGDVRGLRVGIPSEYRVDGMPPEIEALWTQGADWLRDAGAEIVDVSLPHTQYALPAYYIVAPAEASSNLARYDGVRYGRRADAASGIIDMYERTRAEGFGPEVQRRIMIGTYVLSAGYYDAYYIKAQQVRTLIKRDFETAFGTVDVLLTPTTPNAAFAPGEITDPVTMYLNDVFTVPVNLAGLPGISVPAGLDKDGLPLGLQLIGRPFDEETMIRAAGVLEEAAAFSARPEPWWLS